MDMMELLKELSSKHDDQIATEGYAALLRGQSQGHVTEVVIRSLAERYRRIWEELLDSKQRQCPDVDEHLTLRARNAELERLYKEAHAAHEALTQQVQSAPDTFAEMQGEIDRLRDAELIVWGLTFGFYCLHDFKSHKGQFVDTCWIIRVRDAQIDEWRCVRRIDGKMESVTLNSTSDAPILNNPAREWLTAAMTAWREKGGK